VKHRRAFVSVHLPPRGLSPIAHRSALYVNMFRPPPPVDTATPIGKKPSLRLD
jgi:hypothetical protein